MIGIQKHYESTLLFINSILTFTEKEKNISTKNIHIVGKIRSPDCSQGSTGPKQQKLGLVPTSIIDAWDYIVFGIIIIII